MGHFCGMAKASLRLMGHEPCRQGLPSVLMTVKEQKLLDEFVNEFLARHKDMRKLTVDDLPEWFMQKMRDKNPAQAFSTKLPFKLGGHTSLGVLEGAEQIMHDKRCQARALTKALHIKQNSVAQSSKLALQLQEKMKHKQPLTEDEKAFVDATGERTIDRQIRRDYVQASKEAVKEATRTTPRSAREMRVVVEQLCAKYNYSPIQALIEIATNPPKDKDGEPLVSFDELIQIHKMLLPYTAPQMSSVRVADTSGGSLIVKINQINFVPAAPGQPAIAPVADDRNNDIGESWKATSGRKTAIDMLATCRHQLIDGMSKEVRHTGMSVRVPVPTPTEQRPLAPGVNGIGKAEVFEQPVRTDGPPGRT